MVVANQKTKVCSGKGYFVHKDMAKLFRLVLVILLIGIILFVVTEVVMNLQHAGDQTLRRAQRQVSCLAILIGAFGDAEQEFAGKSSKEIVQAIKQADWYQKQLKKYPKLAGLIDPWGNELKIEQHANQVTVVSCGPNGIYDDGKVDDVVAKRKTR